MEREELQRIKERIAKLLSMAGATASSPHEAAIAAQRARALMDKYQVDEYDVSEAAPQEFADEAVTRVFAAIPWHIDVLSVAVAKYNDCHSVYELDIVTYKMESKQNQNDKLGGGRTKKLGKRIHFRGYKNDVELAKQMLDRLLEAIDRLCKGYMQENHPGRYSVRIGGEFKTAAAQALVSKFDEMMVERKQITSSAGTSLVVVKVAAVDEKFGAAEYVSKSRSVATSTTYEDARAFAEATNAGHKAGQSIEIVKRLDD